MSELQAIPENEISKEPVDIFVRVHSRLGPGLLERLSPLKRFFQVLHKTLLTYLKLTDIKLGLLVTFNVNLVKDGIVRLVNNL